MDMETRALILLTFVILLVENDQQYIYSILPSLKQQKKVNHINSSQKDKYFQLLSLSFFSDNSVYTPI